MRRFIIHFPPQILESRYIDWLRLGDQSRSKNFQFSMLARPALGPTQPPIQWVPGALFPGAKCRVMNLISDQLEPRSRKRGSIHPIPHTSSWRNALRVKHRNNSTFYPKYYQSGQVKEHELGKECST
jgi:hypothetical protein